MKRIAALISAISLLLQISSFTTFADDSPTPADLPEPIYQQLVESGSIDKNKDGILTEEEYCNADKIYIDVGDVESIDFLCRLKNPYYISLSDGSISDISPLKNLKTLEILSLDNLPNVTDISFVKEMNLDSFNISRMEQITDEQKNDIMVYHDADISVGYSGVIGVTPMNSFLYREVSLEIVDTSIADFDSDSVCYHSAAMVCGKKAGETEYVLKKGDEVIHRGTIRVSETKPVVLASEEMTSKPSVHFSAFCDTPLILKDNKLYKLKNGSKEEVDNGVSDYVTGNTYDENGKYVCVETILYNDGSISINGEKPDDAKEIKFKQISGSCCVAENGDVYKIIKENDKFKLDLIYSGFGSFLEYSPSSFISNKGELILIEQKKDETKKITYHAFETGIMNVKSSYFDYYIDGSKCLWSVNQYSNNETKIIKCAEDVEYVGQRKVFEKINNLAFPEYIYITTDGTAYSVSGSNKVTLADEEPEFIKAIDFINLYTPPIETITVKGIQIIGLSRYNYHLSSDNTMYADYNDQKIAVADVEKKIALLEDDGKEYLYFMKTDGSIWCYSFSDQEYYNIFAENDEPKIIKGDVNSDGVFDVSDVVLMQKWLLAVPDTKLTDWKAADICEDNILDVFDLCRMKKMLITSSD